MAAKCVECGKKIIIVFEGRFCGDNCKLFVIRDDNDDPSPTGYCKECFKIVVCRDIDYLEDQFT